MRLIVKQGEEMKLRDKYIANFKGYSSGLGDGAGAGSGYGDGNGDGFGHG